MSHALLAPSGAARWLACTPSARLEEGLPDRSSDAADEGTAAHALAEHKLRRALKLRSRRPASQYQDDAMEDHTDSYVAFALELLRQAQEASRDAQCFIEQKVDCSRWVPECSGTADFLLIADGTLHLLDLKYGTGVVVAAEANPQLMIYALGALDMFDCLYDIDRVCLTIYQPRRENISTWETPVMNLRDWGEEYLKPRAQTAYKGEGDLCPGEHCQFCKVKVRCRARADMALEAAKRDFALPPVLTDDEVTALLPVVGEIEKWAKAMLEYATAMARDHGKQWPGYKLVAGRSPGRVFTNPPLVEDIAKAAGWTDIYTTPELLSPAQMEKLMKAKVFRELLGDFVVSPPGKPTLVPESDKREPLAGWNAKEDFA